MNAGAKVDHKAPLMRYSVVYFSSAIEKSYYLIYG